MLAKYLNRISWQQWVFALRIDDGSRIWFVARNDLETERVRTRCEIMFNIDNEFVNIMACSVCLIVTDTTSYEVTSKKITGILFKAGILSHDTKRKSHIMNWPMILWYRSDTFYLRGLTSRQCSGLKWMCWRKMTPKKWLVVLIERRELEVLMCHDDKALFIVYEGHIDEKNTLQSYSQTRFYD